MTSYQRWYSLCALQGAKQNIASTYTELVTRYREPARTYHNLGHVSSCLEELDILGMFAVDMASVEFAIWFHDAIYDTHAKDNEERSASLAEQSLRGMGISGDTSASVRSLVRLTKHDSSPMTVDGQLVVDVDLTILGKSADVYDSYESAIRSEYSWVTDEVFWTKRTELLMAILGRDHIYYTSQFRERYESSARRNLQRSIQRASLYR